MANKQWPIRVTMKLDTVPNVECVGGEITGFLNIIDARRTELLAVRMLDGRIVSGSGVLPMEPMEIPK